MSVLHLGVVLALHSTSVPISYHALASMVCSTFVVVSYTAHALVLHLTSLMQVCHYYRLVLALVVTLLLLYLSVYITHIDVLNANAKSYYDGVI